jgi:hypothetical protein
MTSGTNPLGPDDPLDRLEDALRSLRPRAVSPTTRRRTAARLAAPAASPGIPRLTVSLAFLTAAAALVAAVVMSGWTGSRLASVPSRGGGGGNTHGSNEVIALAGAGCECRVRFTHLSTPTGPLFEPDGRTRGRETLHMPP